MFAENILISNYFIGQILKWCRTEIDIQLPVSLSTVRVSGLNT